MPIYCWEEKEKLENENRELRKQLEFTKDFIFKILIENSEQSEPEWNENFIEISAEPGDSPTLWFKRHKQENHSYYHEFIWLNPDELELLKEIIKNGK